MHAGRFGRAPRAGHRRVPGPRPHADHVPCVFDILDDQGSLRKHVAVFVGDQMVADRDRLSDPVEPGGEIFVFQALSGG